MKIALCIKQVPDTTDIKWTENNTIQREGVESVINPFDVYALELALKLKKQTENTEITVFTMGPLQAKEMLRKALALGCDKGVLISDKKFSGADTYATGLTISTAIKKVMPDFDLVVCGQFAVDGDTAQTGPCIANFLNIPQATFVSETTEIKEKTLSFLKKLEEGDETIELKLPALICVLQNNFEPQRPRIDGIRQAAAKEIQVCTMADLELEAEQVGIKGSPTYVSKAFRNISTHNVQKYKLDVIESVKLLREKISESGAKTNA